MKKYLSFACFIFMLTGYLSAQSSHYPAYADNMLYVKFTDDSPVKFSDHTLTGNEPVKNLVEAYGYWRPVYDIPAERLLQLIKNAERNLDKKLPDLSKEFYFMLYRTTDMGQVEALLKNAEGIENVLRVPIPYLTAIPDFEPMQVYLGEGPSGTGASQVWEHYHNKGSGIRVCDIEYVFNPAHIDLPEVILLTDTMKIFPDMESNRDHGTAVLGELGALDNDTGTTGMATGAGLFFSSIYVDSIPDFPGAVMHAVDIFSPGDVILVELQIAGPYYDSTGYDQYGMVPVEWFEPYYNAIVLAIGQGITVVAGAGNGNQDLDNPVYSTGNGGHHPFLPANRSGAIFVGAGQVAQPSNPWERDRSKLEFSNYGSVVDLQGNGEDVYTTGYGNIYTSAGVNAFYTNIFNGTSSAAPIVAGAAILLQSVYKETTGQLLSSEEIKNILIATGKPQQGNFSFPVSLHIGPLPDVFLAIQYALGSYIGIEENMDAGVVSVFPNPNPGNFTARFTHTAGEMPLVKVTDLMGKETGMLMVATAEGTYEVELSPVPPGIYFLHVYQGNKKTIHKIIVSK